MKNKSLKEKICLMNQYSFEILYYFSKSEDFKDLFQKNEITSIYSVADGLTEDRIIKLIEGRTSLENVINYSLEKIEDIVNKKNDELKLYLLRILNLLTSPSLV